MSSKNTHELGLLVEYVKCKGQHEHRLVNTWKEEDFFVKKAYKCSNELNGAKLNISYNGVGPYVVRYPGGKVRGVDVDIVQDLAKHFNYEFTLIPQRAWFSNKSGVYGGIVGQVGNGASQIGLGHIQMTWLFYQFVEFAQHLYFLEFRYISAKPKALKSYWNLIRPFTWKVWLISFITIWATFGSFISIKKLEKKLLKEESKKSSQLDALSLFQILFSQCRK